VRYFVTSWRRSPVSTDRADPNQQIAEQDMNSWERITPGPTATHSGGFAIYRATIRPPKIVQARGGRIIFHSLSGEPEMYLEGRRVQAVELAPGSATPTLSLLIPAPGGITGPVEIVPH
jgi:hypothetical protein